MDYSPRELWRRTMPYCVISVLLLQLLADVLVAKGEFLHKNFTTESADDTSHTPGGLHKLLDTTEETTTEGGEVRCHCNLPRCVSVGYMCKSLLGACFTRNTPTPTQAYSHARNSQYHHRWTPMHGCVELLPQSRHAECVRKGDEWRRHENLHSRIRRENPQFPKTSQDTSSSPEVTTASLPESSKPPSVSQPQPQSQHKSSEIHPLPQTQPSKSRSYSQLQARPAEPQAQASRENLEPDPDLMCCSQDMCNYRDLDIYIQVEGGSYDSQTDKKRRDSELTETLWFRAATIAVPIAGGFILIILVLLASRMLSKENKRQRMAQQIIGQQYQKAPLYPGSSSEPIPHHQIYYHPAITKGSPLAHISFRASYEEKPANYRLPESYICNLEEIKPLNAVISQDEPWNQRDTESPLPS